ncbi:MAG TPA: hypothetical protein VL051_12295 [Burkholderiaceae bacterium]|nr:hypothetical protein [Burkholderiaceae bacterium]
MRLLLSAACGDSGRVDENAVSLASNGGLQTSFSLPALNPGQTIVPPGRRRFQTGLSISMKQ